MGVLVRWHALEPGGMAMSKAGEWAARIGAMFYIFVLTYMIVGEWLR